MSEAAKEQTNTENPTTKGSSSLSEAEKFLESLNLESQESTNDSSKPRSSADHKDIMSFLDEIAQYPAEPSEQAAKKKQSAVQDASNASAGEQPKEKAQQKTEQATTTASSSSSSSSSGWAAWGTSLWNQASAAVKTTTEQINRSVAGSDSPAAKLLEDRVRHLQELVNKESLGKLGNELRNLTHTILETVAPPISEHELVEVWLSHDMIGYMGLEALVYRAFARVMEQTESGHVVVRKVGDKEDQKPQDKTFRDLNMCEGITQGLKLAKANVDNLIKLHYVAPEARTEYTPQSGAVPVINCPVFLAIQPVRFSPLQLGDDAKSIDEDNQVVFVVMLVDPTNQISFKTYSQSIPLSWLDVPYEENEWVEEKVTEVIRMAVTTIAQDYVWTRMTGAKTQLAKAVAASQEGKAESQKDDINFAEKQ